MIREIKKENAKRIIFDNNKSLVAFCIKNTDTDNKLTFLVQRIVNGWSIFFRNYAIRHKDFKHFTQRYDTKRNEYLGFLNDNWQFIGPQRDPWHWGTRCIKWICNNINSFPPDISLMYMDRCLRCGRPLNDEKSLHRGYGPVCYKKTFSSNRLF